jgi:hypothetical protein
MRYKKTAAMGLFFVAAVTAGTLYATNPWKQPGQEAGLLIKTEKQLNLPQAKDRDVADAKVTKDKYGNEHHASNVTLYYADAGAVTVARKQFGKDWIQRQKFNVDGQTMTTLVSTSEQACAIIKYGTPAAGDDHPNYIAIAGASDDMCRGYMTAS